MSEEGARLSNLIKRMRGKTPQRQFAKQIGVSFAAVRSWEEGESYPVLKNLALIAKASGMSLEELLTYLRGDVELSQAKPRVKIAEDLTLELKALPPRELARVIQIAGALLEEMG